MVENVQGEDIKRTNRSEEEITQDYQYEENNQDEDAEDHYDNIRNKLQDIVHAVSFSKDDWLADIYEDRWELSLG